MSIIQWGIGMNTTGVDDVEVSYSQVAVSWFDFFYCSSQDLGTTAELPFDLFVVIYCSW